MLLLLDPVAVLHQKVTLLRFLEKLQKSRKQRKLHLYLKAMGRILNQSKSRRSMIVEVVEHSVMIN